MARSTRSSSAPTYHLDITKSEARRNVQGKIYFDFTKMKNICTNCEMVTFNIELINIEKNFTVFNREVNAKNSEEVLTLLSSIIAKIFHRIKVVRFWNIHANVIWPFHFIQMKDFSIEVANNSDVSFFITSKVQDLSPADKFGLNLRALSGSKLKLDINDLYRRMRFSRDVFIILIKYIHADAEIDLTKFGHYIINNLFFNEAIFDNEDFDIKCLQTVIKSEFCTDCMPLRRTVKWDKNAGDSIKTNLAPLHCECDKIRIVSPKRASPTLDTEFAMAETLYDDIEKESSLLPTSAAGTAFSTHEEIHDRMEKQLRPLSPPLPPPKRTVKKVHFADEFEVAAEKHDILQLRRTQNLIPEIIEESSSSGSETDDNHVQLYEFVPYSESETEEEQPIQKLKDDDSYDDFDCEECEEEWPFCEVCKSHPATFKTYIRKDGYLYQYFCAPCFKNR